MVSLSSLLAAALDKPPESQAAAPFLVTPTRDCILPPALPPEALPSRLRAVLALQTASSSSEPNSFVTSESIGAAQSAPLASRPSNPPLPLQRLLEDLGPDATTPQNMASLARSLAHFGRPSETAVSSALLFLSTAEPPPESAIVDSHTMFHLFAMFCNDPENASLDPNIQRALASASPSSAEWRVDVLVKAVMTVAAEFNAPLDWRLVIRSLDVDGLEKQLTRTAFVEIAKAYITGSGGSLIPADCILESWMHSAAQLCIISQTLLAPEFINWDAVESFEGATTEDLMSPFSRIALIEKMVELDARDLLQFALRQNSDLVLLSLTCSKPKSNTSLQQKLTVTLLTPLIAAFPKSERRLRQMWNVTPALVEAGIISMWKKDHRMLRVAFVIAVDLHILQDLLSSETSLEFALALAMLAYQEEMLNLETWLMGYLNGKGLQGVSTLTMFMAKKVRLEDAVLPAEMSVNAVRIIFRCLITCTGSIAGSADAAEILESIKDMHQAFVRFNPRIADLSPSVDVADPKMLIGSEGAKNIALGNGKQAEISSSPPDVSESVSEAASTAAALLMPAPLGSNRGPASFPNAIEKETDVFFGNLYKENMSNEEAVSSLRRFKESKIEHDRHLFRCAMHTLFDEYRFFKKYPKRELKITGRLFGSIVNEWLLSGHLQGLAVRCVLDALRTLEPAPQPAGHHASFGIFALERFVTLLKEWPQYCEQLLKLTRLSELKPALYTEMKRARENHRGPVPSVAERDLDITAFDADSDQEAVESTDGGAPPVTSVRDPAADADAVRALVSSPPPSGTSTPRKDPPGGTSGIHPSPSMSMDGSLALSSMNLMNLLGVTPEEASQIVTPDEIVQDKIKFIFNNLSTATLDDKVSEMLDILKEEYVRFFSIYIVVKRASSEANFHHIYLTMLEKMASKAPTLFPLVFDTSYKRVRVLLTSDKIVTIPGERMVLKSLGSWIGSLTLARNQPILRRDLDLKELLIDAYSSGRLIAVVPFVAKVLEASRNSKIFKTTNPWIRGILSLMKEIYDVTDLKLNLKFELQLLCKSLKLDVNDVTPSDLLSAQPPPDKNNNPDFNTKKPVSASPIRSSPSPAGSPTREPRRGYVHSTTGRSGIPVFSLADPQSSSGAMPSIPVSIGSAPSARIDVGANLIPNNLAMSPDTVGDLTSMLANATLTSGNINVSQLTRGPLHTGAATSGSNLPSSGPTPRLSGSLSATEGTLLPNLAAYITISPSLVLFQNNPNLKRLLPLAIDRAIREIIQPVVERSCAIAFLTTKELTLKDFANESDFSKVRRAALQMVQQLAGSLALVTSKEPLRVSMGNQLRTLLSPAVVGDQNLVEQTSQVICAANLEIGCAIIERHAKEKAARDLNEKIAPAFNARRPQQSPYGLGILPGPEVLHVYDDFSRLPRLGTVSSQYSGMPQSSPTPSQPARHPPTVNVNPVTPVVNANGGRPMNGNSHFITEQRANGSVTDSKITERRGSSVVQRAMNNGNVQNELAGPGPIPGRRPTSAANAAVESRANATVYGTPLSFMSSPAEVSAALKAAAGSSSSSAVPNSHRAPASSVTTTSSLEEEPLSTQQVLERFNSIYPQLLVDIEEAVNVSASKDITLAEIQPDHEMHSLWVQIPTAVKRSITADEAGMAVAQKVFKGLYEGDSSLYREIHVLILEGLRESCRRLSKELVSWLAYSEERKKLHRECILSLLKPGSLLHTTNYDELLAKTIDNGRNTNALDFACFLVKRAVIDEPLATAAEFALTLEVMTKIGKKGNVPQLPSAPEGLLGLVEASRNVISQPVTTVSSNPGHEQHSTTSARQQQRPQGPVRDSEPSDPAGVREQIGVCLADWQRLIASDVPHRPLPEHVVGAFMGHVRTTLLFSEEARERFARLTINLIVAVTATALQPPAASTQVELSSAPFTVVDSTVRLVGSLIRSESAADGTTRSIHFLCHFLIALVNTILKSNVGTDLRPHFRVFSGLITELAVGAALTDVVVTGNGYGADSEPVNYTNECGLRELSNVSEATNFLEDGTNGFFSVVRNAVVVNSRGRGCNLGNFRVVACFASALSACSPLIVPSFTFSWLQLMSNKEILPRLLMAHPVHGGNMFLHLLVSMLRFLSTFLRDPHDSLTEGIRTLYKGTLRVLLVLLHDFPEFLCDYHMAIVDVIPHNCVQLRNIVLASFPKSMRLPDPFLPELKVDQLPEMASQPRVLTNYVKHLEKTGLRTVIDNYLQVSTSRHGFPPPELGAYLMVTEGENAYTRYSIPTIGALVLYAGQHAISRSHSAGPPTDEPVTQLVQSLTKELEPEGQYHLFNAIANQLRYPNCHTLYYSRLVLYLFHESSEESVKEQITRVLLERLIANRPHPWGLLVTFVELVKNTAYNFWGHEFVRCAPEIEELFENVAKVCVGPHLHAAQQSLVATS